MPISLRSAALAFAAAALMAGCGHNPPDTATPETAMQAEPVASGQLASGPPQSDGPGWPSDHLLPFPEISASNFGCIRKLEPVGRFYVGNIVGDIEGTLAVARSQTGGTYPLGSVVQLVPTEVMVKREAGFSEATADWEFFELDVSPDGAAIRTRGHTDVVNRFGGNCLDCHAKAEPQWDMICSTDHGCDPIPLSEDMIRALQKTDPRCPPTELTDGEQAALKILLQISGGGASNP
ncbi:MAG: hypothetical protein R3C52_03970 [Hyphomonadaceae bacterium]